MVVVDMCVTERVDEITWFQSRHLSHHEKKQRVARNVERHSQEKVSTSLIKLQTQFSVCHIELEEAVAWRKIHVVDIRHIPC